MKTQTNINILETLSSREIEVLTAEVKETIATDVQKTPKQVFSAADLWRIQNMRKAVVVRRRIFA